jgi:hypothetical protein
MMISIAKTHTVAPKCKSFRLADISAPVLRRKTSKASGSTAADAAKVTMNGQHDISTK